MRLLGRGRSELVIPGVHRPRWFRIVALLAIAFVGFSCSEEPADRDLGDMEDIGQLFGRFVSDHGVDVVPGEFWELDEDEELWSFRGWADLIVHIDRTPSGPLRITLVPGKTSAGMHFRTAWNGEVRSGPALEAGEGLEISIPAAELTPGVHHLKVGRIKQADRPELRENLDCRFARIEYAVDGVNSTLSTDQWPRYRVIRAFLDDGVTGTTTRRRGGLLVTGNQSIRFGLAIPQDGELHFSVSSLSESPARFGVVVDGEGPEVTAGCDEQELIVPVTAGTSEIRLRVDGGEEGLHLWGAPVFRPNLPEARGSVVLITLDTTRRDVLSVYGGAGEASPRISVFSEQATVYENAWSASPWTLPSHASIFTGLYPTRHGAAVSKTRLDSRNETLAVQARRAGFRTAGFSAGSLSASRWGLARGFELYRDPDGFETKGDQQTRYVEDFLDSIDQEAFFLFVNYFDPHATFRAPDSFEARFDVATLRARLTDVPGWDRISQGDNVGWRAAVGGEILPTPAAIDYLKAAYQAEVAFMDHQIGSIMSSLKERGIFDAATIILVADHGEFLGEGGFFSHGCRLDPELTEVPLIIKWPGQTSPDRDDRLLSQVDLYGTVLAALGLHGSPRDGIPIAPDNREAFDGRSTVFMEEHENRVHPLFENMAISGHLYGLQQLDWRQLVWTGGTTCTDRSAEGWIASECLVGWETRLEELATVAALPVESDLSTGDAGLTDEMREHLEALGYIR